MTTQAKDTGPLDWRIAIVDKTGRPTPEFQRRWAIQRANNDLIGSVTLGSGAPPSTPAPSDGAEYIDISTTPYTLYVGSAGSWHKVGAVKFTDLSDAPHSYSGKAGQFVQVNSGATGLQFGSLIGFSFNIGGRPNANEHLGSGVWKSGESVLFENSQPYSIVSLFPATASTVLYLKTYSSGTYTTIGTITFAAAGLVGILNWPSPVTIVPGTVISLWGPTAQDTTLAEITGLVSGSNA
jgi:hypothetical protein